jgi:hypothetical protein
VLAWSRGGEGGGVTGSAIVDGKVVRLKLSPGLAQAWRPNRGKTMTWQQAIEFTGGQKTVDTKNAEEIFLFTGALRDGVAESA